jgi:hypothetical protein
MRDGRVEDALALYEAGGEVLVEAALRAEPAQASELREEADVLASFADRARWDDHRRVAKHSEADSGWKSRKRGRGDRG